MNCSQPVELNVPFGGYKQSGIGRELGEYALDMYVVLRLIWEGLIYPLPFSYTQVKAVHVNIGVKLP